MNTTTPSYARHHALWTTPRPAQAVGLHAPAHSGRRDVAPASTAVISSIFLRRRVCAVAAELVNHKQILDQTAKECMPENNFSVRD